MGFVMAIIETASFPSPADRRNGLSHPFAGIRAFFSAFFAKAFDLFWLIEPNFKDAARNLHFSFGILQYIAVPVALVSFWVAVFCHNLKTRPLVQTNDPHLAEILEPEHAAA